MRIAFAILALPAAASAQPEMGYQSSFATYAPYRETDLSDWRQVNAVVRQMQDGPGHALEASALPSSAQAPAPSVPQAAAQGMDGQIPRKARQP